jgi:hypothetical protein
VTLKFQGSPIKVKSQMTKSEIAEIAAKRRLASSMFGHEDDCKSTPATALPFLKHQQPAVKPKPSRGHG